MIQLESASWNGTHGKIIERYVTFLSSTLAKHQQELEYQQYFEIKIYLQDNQVPLLESLKKLAIEFTLENKTPPETPAPLQDNTFEDVGPPIYDLACNRPNTRRVFSGIGFRTWNPPAQSRNPTTRPPCPHKTFEIPLESNIYNWYIRK
ncbi:hypothetical protein AVEN_97668-1 [Araneus ventricosus]|uniref:Uncharacterized protein n=1 Tax=Araneus ventricosus TaxID=182803 RepID=A0A4Y2GUW7_ARAVE|nr:hypothetical protein AVEN_97668-1 [Araneus ventricosus]